MEITIKTQLVSIEIKDSPTMSNGYTKREVPKLRECIKSAVEEAIKLHKAASDKLKNTDK